jgi:hypothetical protein
MGRIEQMFVIIRDIDPRRPEIVVRRIDGSRWVTTAEGNALVINSKAEARELVEALMEITMTVSMTYLEDEDA